MSASEVINAPIGVVLSGKKYKMRRVSSMKIIAFAEDYIIQRYMRRLRIVGDTLEGDTKLVLLREEMAKMPEGQKLEKAALEILAKGGRDFPPEIAISVLHAALSADQPDITTEDVAVIFEQAAPQETKPVMAMIVGKASAPTPRSTKDSRKRITGRRKS